MFPYAMWECCLHKLQCKIYNLKVGDLLFASKLTVVGKILQVGHVYHVSCPSPFDSQVNRHKKFLRSNFWSKVGAYCSLPLLPWRICTLLKIDLTKSMTEWPLSFITDVLSWPGFGSRFVSVW
jgi:hypothetical protein